MLWDSAGGSHEQSRCRGCLSSLRLAEGTQYEQMLLLVGQKEPGKHPEQGSHITQPALRCCAQQLRGLRHSLPNLLCCLLLRSSACNSCEDGPILRVQVTELHDIVTLSSQSIADPPGTVGLTQVPQGGSALCNSQLIVQATFFRSLSAWPFGAAIG